MTSETNLELDYVISLYHGYGAIAERQFENGEHPLHIQTALQHHIKQWLEQGWDVVLTGSPGDGKTHLMKVILKEFGEDQVGIELDASEQKSNKILADWLSYREQRKPFLLAINHAPLRELARETEHHPTFAFLHKAIFPEDQSDSVIENFIVYSKEQEEVHAHAPFKLVDLSQRELLTDEKIIDELLDKLCTIADHANCEENLPDGCQRCPIRYNAQALLEPRIRDNLKAILSLVARRGYHTTMRDLIGTFAFALTGGKTCTLLWNDPSQRYDHWDYYNLLFSPEARNKLFDAFKKTFDPGTFADGRQDMALWTNQVQEGWWQPEEIMQPPPDLEAMRSRKRRYFFEFLEEKAEDKFSRMLSTIGQEFQTLMNKDRDMHIEVQELVERINLLYAPISSGNGLQGYKTQLRLWNQHRYSVGQSAGYFAMRRISADKLRLYYPRLNRIYQYGNDPLMQIRRDHVLLAVEQWRPGDPGLRIDWEMFQALAAAKQGRAIEVQPFHILRRLDLFLRQLSSEVGRAYAEETIEWSNAQERKLVTVRVNRDQSRYYK